MKRVFKAICLILVSLLMGCGVVSQNTIDDVVSNVVVPIVVANNTPKPAPIPVPAPIPTPTPDPMPIPDPPKPVPVPDPVPPAPVVSTEDVIADFNLLPDLMRAQGWNGSDNELLWCLFSSYGSHEGEWLPQFAPYHDPIKDWFTIRVDQFAYRMKQDQNLKVTIFANDRNDSGGVYLKDRIVTQLRSLGILELWYKIGCVYIWSPEGGRMECD